MSKILEKIKNHPLTFMLFVAGALAGIYPLFFPLPVINRHVPCKNENEVASFSVRDKNDQRIVDINKILNEKNCVATGPHYPKEADREIVSSEIRYFRMADAEDAKTISKYIKDRLGLDFNLVFNKESAHKVNKGYLEIWIK
jgi:hypothetical protein